MQLNLSLARVRSPNEGRRLLLPAQHQRRTSREWQSGYLSKDICVSLMVKVRA